MLPDLDDNPAAPHVLANGLDLFAKPEPFDPTVVCEVCGHRWTPLPQNLHKAHVCSNACRMRAKKNRAKNGPNRPLHPMKHKPWTYVRKKNQ